MARLQPQAGPALTSSATDRERGPHAVEPVEVDELVERHRDGELSLADVARAVAAAGLDARALPGSGLNACELGVVEATLGRLSTPERG